MYIGCEIAIWKKDYFHFYEIWGLKCDRKGEGEG